MPERFDVSNTDFDQLDPQKRRQFIRFDPTINTGALLEVVAIVVSVTLAYSALKSDQATQKIELDQVKASAAADKTSTKESLTEIKGDVKEIQRSLVEVNKVLAVIQANQPKGRP